jgi:hypothetical protein
MRVHSSTRYAAIAVLVGALACAGNTARDTDETAAAPQDTASDTLNGQVQNPPGYRGMERDTAIAPPSAQEPSDTFLQNQGVGAPQDTAGYSGAERIDTTGQANQGGWTDTTGANQTGMDTTGMSGGADTTGYDPSQQPAQDTLPR